MKRKFNSFRHFTPDQFRERSKEYFKTGPLFSLDDSPQYLELRAMPYGEYLETEWWREICEIALDRAGHKCQMCNASDTQLHCHHRVYDNRGCWKEVDDVIVLCKECHDAAPHEKIKNQSKTIKTMQD